MGVKISPEFRKLFQEKSTMPGFMIIKKIAIQIKQQKLSILLERKHFQKNENRK